MWLYALSGGGRRLRSWSQQDPKPCRSWQPASPRTVGMGRVSLKGLAASLHQAGLCCQ